MSDEHKTTAELNIVIDSMQDRYSKDIKGITASIKELTREIQANKKENEERSKGHSDEINRNLPSMIRQTNDSIRILSAKLETHADSLGQIKEDRRFFGRAAITAVFTIITGAIIVWCQVGFGGKS